MWELGHALSLARQFDKAIELLLQLLEKRKAQIPPDLTATWSAMDSLARSYLVTRKTDEGIALFEQSLLLPNRSR
jgi:hypothetical protein